MVTKILPMGQQIVADNEGVAYQELFREIPPSGDLSPALPAQLLLGNVRDGRLRVQSPISVKLTRDVQNIVAEAVDFNEFGFGKNLSEALIDLQHTIAELYFTLDKEQDRLGGDLQRVWARLQEKIRRL